MRVFALAFPLASLAVLCGFGSCELSDEEKATLVAEIKIQVYAEAHPIIEQAAGEILALDLAPDQNRAKLIADRATAQLQGRVPDVVDEKGKDAKAGKFWGGLAGIVQLFLTVLLSAAVPKS